MAYCADIIDRRASEKPVASFFIRVLDFLRLRDRRREAMQDLERLSDRELSDIGVCRHDIAAIVDREIGRLRLDEFRSRL